MGGRCLELGVSVPQQTLRVWDYCRFGSFGISGGCGIAALGNVGESGSRKHGYSEKDRFIRDAIAARVL